MRHDRCCTCDACAGERCQAERAAQGLPPRIVDTDLLRRVSAAIRQRVAS